MPVCLCMSECVRVCVCACLCWWLLFLAYVLFKYAQTLTLLTCNIFVKRMWIYFPHYQFFLLFFFFKAINSTKIAYKWLNGWECCWCCLISVRHVAGQSNHDLPPLNWSPLWECFVDVVSWNKVVIILVKKTKKKQLFFMFVFPLILFIYMFFLDVFDYLICLFPYCYKRSFS